MPLTKADIPFILVVLHCKPSVLAEYVALQLIANAFTVYLS